MGIIKTALENIQDLLAASDEFQEWVGADDAAEAEESIFIMQAPGDTAENYAVLSHGTISMTKAGVPNTYAERGTVNIRFRGKYIANELEETEESEPTESEIIGQFMEFVGDIVEDVADLAGTAGYPDILTIRQRSAFQRCLPRQEGINGQWAEVEFEVEWF